MDLRLIGPPDVVQAWAGMIRDQYGARTTLMTCRHTDQLRCYVRMDDRTAALFAAQYAGCEHPVQGANKKRKP